MLNLFFLLQTQQDITVNANKRGTQSILFVGLPIVQQSTTIDMTSNMCRSVLGFLEMLCKLFDGTAFSWEDFL